MKLHHAVTDNRAFKSFSALEDRFRLKHGNKYDYSQVVYRRGLDEVTIVCPIHGPFQQSSKDHLSGRGCYHCGHDSTHKKQTKTTETFIKQAKKIHEDMYDYTNTIYTNSNTKLNIGCKIHGPFPQSPGHHLMGKGCPDCAKYGFDTNKPATLYYLKIIVDNKEYYKIGITNRTVNKRYKISDKEIIQILHQIHYSSGQEALSEETRYKRKYKEYQYQGPNILSSGNTELFTEDILNKEFYTEKTT